MLRLTRLTIASQIAVYNKALTPDQVNYYQLTVSSRLAHNSLRSIRTLWQPSRSLSTIEHLVPSAEWSTCVHCWLHTGGWHAGATSKGDWGVFWGHSLKMMITQEGDCELRDSYKDAFHEAFLVAGWSRRGGGDTGRQAGGRVSRPMAQIQCEGGVGAGQTSFERNQCIPWECSCCSWLHCRHGAVESRPKQHRCTPLHEPRRCIVRLREPADQMGIKYCW